MFVNRKERLARVAIEEIEVSLLRNLGESFDSFAVFMQRVQRRRRRKIAIPDVVVDTLKVPQQLSRRGIEREYAVGVKIVADAVAAVEVHHGRAGRHKDDAALGIEREAGPIVRCSRSLPRIGWPGLVARFAGMWNRMKAPAQRAGMHVVGTDIAG